jgi:hypothetical protein
MRSSVAAQIRFIVSRAVSDCLTSCVTAIPPQLRSTFRHAERDVLMKLTACRDSKFGEALRHLSVRWTRIPAGHPVFRQYALPQLQVAGPKGPGA